MPRWRAQSDELSACVIALRVSMSNGVCVCGRCGEEMSLLMSQQRLLLTSERPDQGFGFFRSLVRSLENNPYRALVAEGSPTHVKKMASVVFADNNLEGFQFMH